MSRKLLIVYLFSVMLALVPFTGLGLGDSPQIQLAATAGDLLNPDKWFEALKKNITIPISKDREIKLLTPEETLQEVSPRLQEINTGVQEETGVDLAKFIKWFAEVLKVFFQILVNILEQVSEALGS